MIFVKHLPKVRNGIEGMLKLKNKKVVLSSRPGVDKPPQAENFSCETCPTPNTLTDGQVLVQTLYLSVDPYIRSRMNENSGVDYAPAWNIGETINGPAVGSVIESKAKELKEGDLVTSKGLEWPWQNYTVQHESWLQKVQDLNKENASLALGIFGITGLTAAIGVMERANIVPNSNQTMVVSGAAGACGSVAGQLGKILGCGKLVGICGSEEKCKFIVESFNYDGAICYKTENVTSQLSGLCPNGVDIYFDNVGGEISDAVINCMNKDSSVILCGQIAVYNEDVPYPPPIKPNINEVIKQRSISRERFLVLNYQSKFPQALDLLMDSYKKGLLKSHETVTYRLENASKAFVSMMNGGKIGKQIVKL